MTQHIRSILFAPANQPGLLAKMPRANADVAIACLEDGTPVPEKESARSAATDAISALRDDGWEGQMYVRVNEATSQWFADDVRATVDGPFDGIVLPKTNTADDVVALYDALDRADGGRLDVIIGIETGAGVMNLEEILGAGPSAVGVYFGAEDYATSIGGVRSASNVEVHYPRSRIGMLARVFGMNAFDHGVLEVGDDERFRRECGEARGLGYTGKICVHPRQVELANELFLPSPDEVDEARRLLEEYETALAEGYATPAIDGRMIDGPLVKRAQAIIDLATR